MLYISCNTNSWIFCIQCAVGVAITKKFIVSCIHDFHELYRYDGKSRQNHELNIHSYIYEEQHPSSASFPVTEEEEREDEDDMYSYQCNLMDHGMLNVNFTDAIAEADGDRIMRSWKFLLLHFFC